MAKFRVLLNAFNTTKQATPKRQESLQTKEKEAKSNPTLKEIMINKISEEFYRISKLRKQHKDFVVDHITINNLYGGRLGAKTFVTQTSLLDPENGILFRGHSLLECVEKLPRAKNGTAPLPEGMFWLLMTGDIPTEEQVSNISFEWARRSKLPPHVETMIHNFPSNLDPMAQLSAATSALHTESVFSKVFAGPVHKTRYWEYAYDDVMSLLGKLPVMAAMIYRNLYREVDKPLPPVDPKKDWSENFLSMLGYENPEFTEFMRLYLTICSHVEGGDVGSQAVHVIGSTLANPYVALGAGLNVMSGPLCGPGAEKTLAFLEKIKQKHGENATDEKLAEFVREELNRDFIIPGYGHPVLHNLDPRYTCLRQFILQRCPEDSAFKLSERLSIVIPPIFMQFGKMNNPWPNVGSLVGVICQHYGMKESDFFMVLHGLSRAIGCMSALIWDRALCLPMVRPQSVTTKAVEQMVKSKLANAAKKM